MNKLKYIFCFLLLYFNRSIAQEKQIFYTIKPVPASDRVNLEIEFKLEGEPDGSTLVSLPVCNYGTPDLYQAVSSFSVGNGKISKEGLKPWQRLINHDPGAVLQINYTISFDPAKTDGNYRPDVTAQHFHFFGSQWLAYPEEMTKDTFRFLIKYKDVPKGWNVFSNIDSGSNNFTYRGTYDKFSGFIAGGKYKKKQVKIKGTIVDIYLDEKYTERPGSLPENIQKIVASQRQVFNDYSQKWFLIVLTGRGEQMAGVAIKNAFICLTDFKNDDLSHLSILAHETFHAWLPGKGKIISGNSPNSFFLYEWFHEGFTEYCSRIILLQNNIISMDDYVKLVNKDIIELSFNPMSKETYKEVADAISQKKFLSTHKDLSYKRGALMAYNWDRLIRQKKTGEWSVLDLVKDVVLEMERTKKGIPDSLFFELVKSKYQIDAAGDWTRYIINGQLPELDAASLEREGYDLVDSTVYRFSAGFNIDSSRLLKKIVGVVKDGNAEKNGLKNNMPIRNISFSASDKPLTVLLANNQEISYLPRGKATYCKLFRKR